MVEVTFTALRFHADPFKQVKLDVVFTDHRHFEHADGTPFFWLGDTWWKGLCKRISLEGFQQLTADRKAKGFTAVQIVAGPYPDEPHSTTLLTPHENWYDDYKEFVAKGGKWDLPYAADCLRHKTGC